MSPRKRTVSCRHVAVRDGSYASDRGEAERLVTPRTERRTVNRNGNGEEGTETCERAVTERTPWPPLRVLDRASRRLERDPGAPIRSGASAIPGTYLRA
jgi:hypothetical protein